MLIIKSHTTIPGKNVIEDLASRNGSPTKDSVCPYEGQGEWFRKMSRGTIGNMLAKLRYQDDFNPDSIHPDENEYVKREEKLEKYNTRLEDIHPSWVLKHLGWMMHRVRNSKDGGFSSDKEGNKEQMSVADADGDLVELADLIVEEDEISIPKFDEYKREIPYLVRRLQTYGASYGIHMMSLIIAYERVKAQRIENIKNTEFLKFNVYKANSMGALKETSDGKGYLKVMSNTDKSFSQWAFKFITRKTDEFVNSYYWDYIKLLDICRTLKIDLSKEDPLEYTYEFLEDMVVTHISNNKEYMSRGGKAVNIVKQAIAGLCLDDYDRKETETVEEMSFKEKIDYSRAKFNLSENKLITDFRSQRNEEIVNSFLSRYRYIYKDVPSKLDSKEHIINDGFVCDKHMNPLIFNTKALTQKELLHTRGFFMIHISGFLVAITGLDTCGFLPMNLACRYLDVLLPQAMEYYKPAEIEYNLVQLIHSIKAKFGNDAYGTWKQTRG